MNSQELNFLVYRYLHESGFTHTAFTLGYEATLNKSTIDENVVPPGALVTFVQKGIQYLELEANLTPNDFDIGEDFSFIQPLDLITKDGKKKGTCSYSRKRKEMRNIERELEKEKIERDKSKHKEKKSEDIVDGRHDEDNKIRVQPEENVKIEVGPEPMEIDNNLGSVSSLIPNSDVTVLEGHTSEVFVCAWSAAGSLLALGSGDSTAPTLDIDWRNNVSFATCSTDNMIYVCKVGDDPPVKTFAGHQGEVNAIKWDPTSTLLASCSDDSTAKCIVRLYNKAMGCGNREPSSQPSCPWGSCIFCCI